MLCAYNAGDIRTNDPLILIYTEQKKVIHTLFSNISKNTYPMKINFMSN